MKKQRVPNALKILVISTRHSEHDPSNPDQLVNRKIMINIFKRTKQLRLMSDKPTVPDNRLRARLLTSTRYRRDAPISLHRSLPRVTTITRVRRNRKGRTEHRITERVNSHIKGTRRAPTSSQTSRSD